MTSDVTMNHATSTAAYLPTIPEFPEIYQKTGVYPGILEKCFKIPDIGLRGAPSTPYHSACATRAKHSEDHMDTPKLLVVAKTVTEQSFNTL